ncbi:reverse transcriptase domain-containing protein [Tanacetum coccineum]
MVVTGAAQIWLEKEPPRSILTWDDLVSKFINQFFPPSKTTNLRNEITRFQQIFDESFYEAWDRFNDLLRAGPHHGFLELHQLDTFYNALNSNDQNSLNSATGVSTSSSTPAVSSDVAELKDMVRALLLDKKNQSQASATVKAVEESCVTCGAAHSHRNCPATDGNVYHDNIQEYVSQAATDPAPQAHGVSKADFKSYVKANDAVMQNMQSQMTNITDLLTKFLNSNTGSTSGSGSLPSNTIANPKGDVKTITTRSGVSYNGPQIPSSISSLPKEMENEPKCNPNSFGAYDPPNSLSPSFTPFEEVDLSNGRDRCILELVINPPGVDGIYDSEGDTVYLEELLSVINSDPNLPPSPVCEFICGLKELNISCKDPPD